MHYWVWNILRVFFLPSTAVNILKMQQHAEKPKELVGKRKQGCMDVLSSEAAAVVLDYSDEFYAVVGSSNGAEGLGGEQREVDLRVTATLFKKDAVQRDDLLARLAQPPSSSTSSSSASSSEPPAAKKSKTAASSSSTGTDPISIGDLYLVDYSSKVFALFGDSKPIKQHLLDLGGKFNSALTDPTTQQRASGWVFDLSKKATVLAHLQEKEASGSFPPLDAPATDQSVPKILLKNDCYLVQYSDKCVAVFGPSKAIKDELKALGGRYNGSLKDPTIGGAVAPG